MPLPLRKLRVFPNPWILITLENGPQGALAYSGARNIGPLRYVGAVPRVDVLEARDLGDPRGDRAKYVFTFPGLDGTLLGGEAIELPANEPFFHDRLHDGSLVPADVATAKAFPESRFKSLAEARAAGIAEFESHFGPGSFEEAFSGESFAAGGKAPVDDAAEKAVLKAAAEKAEAAAKAAAGASGAPTLTPNSVPTDDAVKAPKGGK